MQKELYANQKILYQFDQNRKIPTEKVHLDQV